MIDSHGSSWQMGAISSYHTCDLISLFKHYNFSGNMMTKDLLIEHAWYIYTFLKRKKMKDPST